MSIPTKIVPYGLVYIGIDRYSFDMDRRTATETISANLRAVIESSHSNVGSVAKAAAVTPTTFDGSQELSLDVVVAVGGFLCVPTSSLLEGVAA